MRNGKMITFKLENNNEYKMNNNTFKTLLKNSVNEIGWVDSYYYWKEEINYYFDFFSEEIGYNTDYEYDSYEITNKEEITKEINKVFEKILK